MDKNHRLYVGTVGEGLFRSTDGGQDFRRACEGMFVECHVLALAVHPRDPRVLYLGNELGLWRSRDGADRWERVASCIANKARRRVTGVTRPQHMGVRPCLHCHGTGGAA